MQRTSGPLLGGSTHRASANPPSSDALITFLCCPFLLQESSFSNSVSKSGPSIAMLEANNKWSH